MDSNRNCRKLNLDVASPDEVPKVLYDAVDAYFDSVRELNATWQNPQAGVPWAIIALILKRAANQIEERLQKRKKK